jgi:hypothetical protein
LIFLCGCRSTKPLDSQHEAISPKILTSDERVNENTQTAQDGSNTTNKNNLLTPDDAVKLTNQNENVQSSFGGTESNGFYSINYAIGAHATGVQLLVDPKTGDVYRTNSDKVYYNLYKGKPPLQQETITQNTYAAKTARVNPVIEAQYSEIEKRFIDRYLIRNKDDPDLNALKEWDPSHFIYTVSVFGFDDKRNLFELRMARTTDTVNNFFFYDAKEDKFYYDENPLKEIGDSVEFVNF